VFFVELPLQGL